MARGDVVVIGGGWSVRDVPLARWDATIIAVNDSAIHAPACDYAVSMDRLWSEDRLPVLLDIEGSASEFWIRRSAIQNMPTRATDPRVKVFDCDHKSVELETGTIPPRLNGTNSGVCALNLALQRVLFASAPRIFLLGFDMCRDARGRAYWYPPYPWSGQSGGSTSPGKYSHWSKQFDRIAEQFREWRIPVFNVSPGSAIANFPKMTPAEFQRAIR